MIVDVGYGVWPVRVTPDYFSNPHHHATTTIITAWTRILAFSDFHLLPSSIYSSYESGLRCLKTIFLSLSPRG